MNWLLLKSGSNNAAANMAWDEALLEAVARLGRPVLRFYTWLELAATFGYAQKFAEVERLTLLRPLIRRPTGGGLVPHDADWTYSVVIPPGHAWFGLSATGSYQRVHEWVRDAFAALDVQTELATRCRKSGPGQCFIGWEKHDVLWQGRKVAGAAQRRNRHGLLIQGSVQPPPLALKRAAWEQALGNMVEKQFDGASLALQPDPELCARAGELAQMKYSKPTHNQRR